MRFLAKTVTKYYWSIYIITFLLAFTVIRLFFCDDKQIIQQLYINLYCEDLAVGLYMSAYCLLFVPICTVWKSAYIGVRCDTAYKYINIFFRTIITRSVEMSAVLTIGYFVIIGTSAPDWCNIYNIRYIIFLCLTQIVGWILLGLIFVVFYMFIRNVLWTFVAEYLLIALFNYSCFITADNLVVRHTRIYYFMFHLDVYNSLAEIISAFSMNVLIILVLLVVLYKRISTMEFIQKQR